jgi:hypothetical protein
MMNKKNVYTTLGIILSFVIAIGGWVLTSVLIEIKSQGLLSMTLSVNTNILDNTSMNETPLTRPNLTENEIVAILRNWDTVGRETPHEPTNQQLNMEQAIDTGREWLSFISELAIFPDELLRFNNVRAYLFQNLPLGHSGQFFPSAYSYWTLTFINDLINVNMVINAVTGQVWKTDINVFKFDVEINDYDISNALTAFASFLGLNYMEDGEIIIMPIKDDGSNNLRGTMDDILIITATTRESESITASHNFANGNAEIAVMATGWRLEDCKWSIGNFKMHLTDIK